MNAIVTAAISVRSIPSGKKSGTMTLKKIRMVMRGTPLMNSMKVVETIRKIGNFDVRARANRTPKGKARTIVKKKIINVMAKPPMKKSPGTFAVEGVFIAVISQQSMTIVPIHTLVYLIRAGFWPLNVGAARAKKANTRVRILTIMSIWNKNVAKPTKRTAVEITLPFSPISGFVNQSRRREPTIEKNRNIGISVEKRCPVSKSGSLRTRKRRKSGEINQVMERRALPLLSSILSLMREPRKYEQMVTANIIVQGSLVVIATVPGSARIFGVLVDI